MLVRLPMHICVTRPQWVYDRSPMLKKLTHWSYIFLALTHRNDLNRKKDHHLSNINCNACKYRLRKCVPVQQIWTTFNSSAYLKSPLDVSCREHPMYYVTGSGFAIFCCELEQIILMYSIQVNFTNIRHLPQCQWSIIWTVFITMIP